MEPLWQDIVKFFTPERLKIYWQTGLILVVGFLLARLVRFLIQRVVGRRVGARLSIIAGKVAFYLLVILSFLLALRHAEVDLSLLLGAAGVLTIALGFAAQTSVSNLISGLFLVGERAFVVGDLIQVGDKLGYVDSIDLLSVKLRTFDNVLVRLPNETLLKSEITNLTHYPIRRLDLTVGVAYKEDIARAKEVLMQVAERNPLCLDEPKPLFFVKQFGESSVDLRFSVWFTQANIWESQNHLQQEIKAAFDEAGIEIPFPHRTLYTGSVTEPFPVRVVREVPAGDFDD